MREGHFFTLSEPKHGFNYDPDFLCLIKYHGKKNSGQPEEKDYYEVLDLDHRIILVLN
jgi:hypothetical protein